LWESRPHRASRLSGRENRKMPTMKPEELRAAGDWVVHLKVILKTGANNAGNRPQEEHRSTKKAVRLLLSNLKDGVAQKDDAPWDEKRVQKIVFNAVDQLMDDKMATKESRKTKLEALDRFSAVLTKEFAAQAKKSGALEDPWKHKIEDAVRGLKYEEMEKLFRSGNMTAEVLLASDQGRDALEQRPTKLRVDVLNAVDPDKLDTKLKAAWVDQMEKGFRAGGISAEDLLGTDRGKKVLEAKPEIRGDVLSSIDPAKFERLDLGTLFGRDKDDVIADAMVSVGRKQHPLNKDGKLNRAEQFDPALFDKLVAKIPVDTWNDKNTPRKRGLGPQVCQGLWENGNYDQIVTLIDKGVDTSVAARLTGTNKTSGPGVYSGFFQPIQHVVSDYVRDVDLLTTNPGAVADHRKGKAQGAKKIIQALETKNTAVMLTKWSDVKGSEMITEFTKAPGTIWGFENIRMPYVQAGHETPTPKGAQPLRMMELWEAVDKATKSPAAYNKLIENPSEAIKEFVEEGVNKIKAGIAKVDTDATARGKYGDIAHDEKKYIENFRKDATAFLTEWAGQIPKGTYAGPGADGPGKSDIAGVMPGKMVGGLACKAGLWWAQKENKPVYYCLDGIDMNDVINYKKVKNKAIQDFIAEGGKTAGAKGHDEVITMVELREILKNWEGLKGTVKLVVKGKILTGDDLKNKVEDWQNKMNKANKQAGRTPAPPKAEFAKELNALDPTLMAKLEMFEEGDMDARDIVKKSGYLVKVANSRPRVVLQYIMSRCEVLTRYGLLSGKLPEVAAQLFAKKDGEDTSALKNQLRQEIEKCHAKFQPSLKKSLLS